MQKVSFVLYKNMITNFKLLGKYCAFIKVIDTCNYM